MTVIWRAELDRNGTTVVHGRIQVSDDLDAPAIDRLVLEAIHRRGYHEVDYSWEIA